MLSFDPTVYPTEAEYLCFFAGPNFEEALIWGYLPFINNWLTVNNFVI